jgi:hypothetical protein
MMMVFTIPSFCQEQPDVPNDKNVLKINTLSLFLGTGSVFYERKLSDKTSGQMGVAYLSYRFDRTKFSGLILTPEFRIYPRKNAIKGFYVAPYLRYFNFTIKNTTDNDNGSLTVLGGGFLLGRQWITNSGFTMDLFFGGHYGSASVKTNSGNSEWVDSNIFSGFRTRVGFALGFAF